MEYQHDIFYDVEILPYEEILKLIDEAISYSYEVTVDKIVGWQRQVQPDVDPKEWIEKTMNEKSMVRFIHRRGYSDPWCVQLAIREYGEFLWINMKEEHLKHFVDKYKLDTL